MLKYHIQTSGRSLHAKKLILTISELRFKRCMQFMTTVIRFTPMLMTKAITTPTERIGKKSNGDSVDYQ